MVRLQDKFYKIIGNIVVENNISCWPSFTSSISPGTKVLFASSGQKTMSKNVIFNHESNTDVFALLSDEITSSVDLWSLTQEDNMDIQISNNPQVIQKLPSNCNESILGISRSLIDSKEWVVYCTSSQAILYNSK